VLTMQESIQSSLESPICHVACDAADELQSSVCNALVGFYRVAFACLRNVLESMSIGAQLEISSDSTRFRDWRNGDLELGLGWAADLLHVSQRVALIESHCRTVVNDDLFHHKRASDGGGFVRRLFRRLSKYTHGAPGFTEADLRDSNGPIFVPGAFQDWSICFRLTYSLALVEIKLACQVLAVVGSGSSNSLKSLCEKVLADVGPNEDGISLLRALPRAFWD
jgi:hypothetical protein